jgi:type VI secretion system protein VasI
MVYSATGTVSAQMFDECAQAGQSKSGAHKINYGLKEETGFTMKRFTLIMALCFSSQSATADDIAECAQLSNDLDRLACYDIVSGRTPEAQEVETDTAWDVRTETSAFDDTTSVYMSVESEEVLTCGRGLSAPRNATLMLRCSENTTAMYLSTDCHLASGHGGYGNIDLRIDDSPAFELAFEASTNNSALGLWNGGRSIGPIKRLIGADQLLMRFTPYAENAQTVTFPISGLEEAIAPLREACNW